ncbi:hypothetical protein YC2023_049402 [Brassica napus]
MVELQRAAEFKLGGDDGPTITPSESLDAKDDNASGRRKVSRDCLEDTSQFKAIYFGFSDYNDRLLSTLQL